MASKNLSIVFVSAFFILIALIPPVHSDPAGELYYAGTTWYELQHHGTCGRQIAVSPDGNVSVVWTNGLNSGSPQRHVYYNFWNPETGFEWTGGIQVDQSPKAGYCALETFGDGRACIAFHQAHPILTSSHAAVAFDFLPFAGAALTFELPWVYEWGNDLEVIWPQMAIGRDGILHFVSTENPWTNLFNRIYYCRGEFDTSSFTMNYDPPEQVLVDSVMTISAAIAASKVSDRVAIGWMPYGVTTGGEPSAADNDLVICISENGSDWDFSDTINVTSWIPPDSTLLPDTLAANRDTLRCVNDMCLLFDNDDNLHVFFTTRAFYYFTPWGYATISYNSYIWHWDEISQTFSLAANGWFENGYPSNDYWNVNLRQPCAGIDTLTGDLYCTYLRNLNPVDTSQTLPFPYQIGDTTQISYAGYPSADVWMTKSGDGGLSWSEGVNITNTMTPYLAVAGHCSSEVCPSMAYDVTDDSAHVFYILDYDCGSFTAGGMPTLNDVIYQRVPIDEIPNGPILPPYPMHCDSTGFPGEVTVDDKTVLPVPAAFILYPPRPNPFNAETAISFKLQAASKVELRVFDITGREVSSLVTGHLPPGQHSVVWNAEGLASGIYFVKFVSRDYQAVEKLVLMK